VIVARALVTPFVIGAVFLCCFAAELVPVYLERTPVQIVGGYSVGRNPLGALQLYEPPYEPQDEAVRLAYPVVVQEALVRIGWDEDFILVERHPLPPELERTLTDQPDSSRPKWYIVVVSTGEVHTTWSFDKFLTWKAELGVPDTIEMRDARQVYYGGWIPRNKPPY